MQYISPSQLARAAGVSESSVKRWCDQGRIPIVKTAGGHRRLSLDSATEFLRQTGGGAHPELLGLPTRSRAGERTIPAASQAFYQALIGGDDESSREILMDLHLSGERASRIGDAVVAPAFKCVGEGWERDEVQIYQERRGCRCCLHALEELKKVIPVAKSSAPLAIGGAPECDSYMLPTALVEIVLQQGGWRAQSLGSRLPFSTLVAAVRELRPALFWLSVSYVEDDARFIAGYRDFYEQVQNDVAVIVGGRALSEDLRRQMSFTAYGDNLQHLEGFAKTLKRSLNRVQ